MHRRAPGRRRRPPTTVPSPPRGRRGLRVRAAGLPVPPTGQVNFNSHTDAVVRMAVALVNLLTEGEQRGRKYLPPAGVQRSAQLNALFEGARSTTAVTVAEAGAFGGVAAELRGVFAALAAGDIDDAARRVNRMLKATGAHPSLERHDGEAWHIHFHAADEQSRVNGWAAGCA